MRRKTSCRKSTPAASGSTGSAAGVTVMNANARRLPSQESRPLLPRHKRAQVKERRAKRAERVGRTAKTTVSTALGAELRGTRCQTPGATRFAACE